MKKAILILFITALSLTQIFACASDSGESDASARTPRDLDYTDFIGQTIGIPTGYAMDVVIENQFQGTAAFYSDLSAPLEDVRRGRVSGLMLDNSVALVITNKPGNEDLMIVDVPVEWFSGPFAAISINQDIIDRFNVFLAELNVSGTLENMIDYWLFDNPGSDPPMPDIKLPDSGDVLTVATTGLTVPFSYFGDNGQLKGLCIEIIKRFALHEGMRLEFYMVDFAGMIPSVVTGRADIAFDALTITEERKKSVIFTEPYFYDHAAIITLRYEEGTTAASDSLGFTDWFRTGIQRNLIQDARWRLIVDGLGVTMTIAFFAQIFGTIVGALVCWLLTSKNRIIRGFGNFYCGIIHGTPMVVLLMVTYYVIFGNTNVIGIIIAVITFSMITGSGIARNLKGAIETVDITEIEAARSIGFSAFKAFIYITLPQAIKRALPSYTNGFVELVKATAIVGFIAIQDLTRAGDIIRSRTYDAFFPLLTVALIYLLVTTICVQVFKLIVKRFGGES